jgi:hypothetical protein
VGGGRPYQPALYAWQICDRALSGQCKADVGSPYGTVGSLVIVLVWVYYSSQILLFGAEFTPVYANRYGSHIVAAESGTSIKMPSS